MYKLNNIEGLQIRIRHLNVLKQKINNIPGNNLDFTSACDINGYLSECERLIQKEIDKRIKEKKGVSK